VGWFGGGWWGQSWKESTTTTRGKKRGRWGVFNQEIPYGTGDILQGVPPRKKLVTFPKIVQSEGVKKRTQVLTQVKGAFKWLNGEGT